MTDILPDSARARGFVVDHDAFGTSDVAVVHIDGNDMGLRVMGLDSVAAYQEFSNAVTHLTREAAKAAVARIVERAGDGSGPWPFRPVVLGGDDVTVITRERDALTFVETFIEAFEAGARGHTSTDGLTASAGVAFVKSKAPFSLSYELAESLCSYAKDRLRGPPTPSAVAFYRPTASLHVSWEQVRRTDLNAVGPDEASVAGALTLSPYRLSGLGRTVSGLRDLTEAIRALPRGTYREWTRVAQGDPGRARDRWQRMREVARPDRLAALDAALAALGCTDGPWTAAYETPIFDALTLLALEREEER